MLSSKLPVLFSRTKRLEAQFDEFMDRVIEVSLIFERAFRNYLRDGYTEEFAEAVKDVSALESRNDELKKDIETRLYEQTLIPDLRGDVLSLIKGLDSILGVYQGNCFRIAIEKPDIPQQFNRDFKDLAKTSTACVDSVILASRAFFTNFEAVRDHNVKVMYFETEADMISTRLKTKVFESDLPMSHKNQLRYFCDKIEETSNCAENVADNLAIYALKRST